MLDKILMKPNDLIITTNVWEKISRNIEMTVNTVFDYFIVSTAIETKVVTGDKI